jgi:putative OmpL-like beta-barrel porin-2
VSAAVFTGPEPFPVATGHLGSWQTGAGAGVKHNWSPRLTQEFLVSGSWDFNDPAVNRTSPTYGTFTILTYHLNQYLDLNARGEWFWDKDGARTGNAAHYGEVAVGLNITPNRWINFRPELRGDFASEPGFGSVSSSDRERSQFTAAFDVILKFH